MDGFEIVRRKARQRHQQVATVGRLPSGLELARRSAAAESFDIIPLEPDDTLLNGAEAVLDRGIEAIFYRRCAPAAAAAIVAHELGHLVLHEGTSICDGDDIDVSSPDEAVKVGAARVEDYGVRERQELQANVFAREFLLPRAAARQLFLERGWKASEISRRRQLPVDIVYQQLCDALLLPEVPEEEPDDGETAAAIVLDASQRQAAEHDGSPLLLEAGPGTGKTRTLVARVVRLIERGAEPSSILALTFSNKAAREITERVAKVLPEQAAAVWSGTFHAFGLELLRKYHDRVDLDPDVRVFDRSDAIALLEEMLPTLGLVHHQNLYEPALELKEMLAAVSRAKDELVDPARYLELATAMAAAAVDEKQRIAAERALEVAKVYAVYQQTLGDKKAVDFGDLIMITTRLLETAEDVRSTLRQQYQHVLVDEYQDINRASARLVAALVGNGKNLWVVGDSRQSIYRFRGASSVNMALFSQDFEGASRKSLKTNYRSTPEIVDTFCGYARRMRASQGALPLRLEAHRPRGGERPEQRALADSAGEIAAVAEQIRQLHEEHGVPLSEQAVLCRSNGTLRAFSEGLEELGLPSLHLGSLFERDEVRDLLSLLALLTEAAGSGLMRIAALPAYDVPIEDVRTFLQATRELEIMAFDGLEKLAEIEGLSKAGREGLERLAGDLEGLQRSSTPWRILTSYLFDRSDMLSPLLHSTGTSDRTRLAAIYQLLSFVRGPGPGGKGWPARRVLDRVRRMVLLGEERDLRQIPAAALHLDAVRLMTIHGSKGLEFEAVHIPSMMTTGLPSSFKRARCPPPPGLITSRWAFESTEANESTGDPGGAIDADREQHEEEEECLFFVALSRAKSYLRLYRPNRVGAVRRKPSRLLAELDPRPRTLEVEESTLPVATPEEGLIPLTGEPLASAISRSDLVMYERCPRRYFYSRVFGLVGSRRESAFTKTHQVIYRVIDQLKEHPEDGLESSDILARLETEWQEGGPVGHAFESDYRRLAEAIVGHLVDSHAWLAMTEAESLPLDLAAGSIDLKPDLQAFVPDGRVLLRLLRTGRKGAFKADDTVHGALQEAARRQYGEGGYQIEVVHLTDGQTTPVDMTQRKLESRIEKSGKFLAALSRGSFPAAPEAMTCPRCPYFFVCPTVPSGRLEVVKPELDETADDTAEEATEES